MTTSAEDLQRLGRDIFDDIGRHGDRLLDDVDMRGYRDALRPMTDAIRAGRLAINDRRVWEVKIGVRNHRFRPTFDEVREIVLKALGIELAAPIEARQVVTRPALPAIPATAGSVPPGAWMRHLAPSGDAGRDAFLVGVCQSIETAQGPGVAAVAAQRMTQARQQVLEERAQQDQRYLDQIPPAVRDAYLTRANGSPSDAHRLFCQDLRQRQRGSAYNAWQQVHAATEVDK